MTKNGVLKAAAVLGLCAASGCNSVSGVGDLEIGNGGPGVAKLSTLIPMPGLTVTEIALYQAVKRPLMTGGMPATSDVPIVAGRDALIRVFVQTDTTFSGHPVTARLFFDGNPVPLETTQSVAGSSTDDKLDSTLYFQVPGDQITTDAKYRIVLGEDTHSTLQASFEKGYPEKGYDPIPAESVGASLKIVIAPVAYGADGSNRLPDLDEAQIQMYTDAFRAMYPAPKVELTVRKDPIPWKQAVGPSGNGWGELLDHVGTVREMDGAGPDVYYFAPFTPAENFGQFCGGGCVAGLGMLGDPGDTHSRAAIGLGYAGADTGVTALHEIGHNHGRQHAPCQTPDPDPKFPHKGGQDGAWGYNLLTQQLYPPTMTDIMGYCTPVWVSDYTYTAFVTRMKLVNHAEVEYPPGSLNRMYDRVLIGMQGEVKWLEPVRLATPPMAEPKTVLVESNGVSETVSGQLYRFNHIEGGIVFWPASERPIKAVRLDVQGHSVRLAR